MRREYRLYPLFEPPKMRGCPSHHAVTFSSLSWLTTHRPFLKGCSTAVRAAGEVFASPGRLPAASSYRVVAAGASAGAQKVCHRRQGSNSCLIRPLPCAAHALCGPFRGGRYLYGCRGARRRPRLDRAHPQRRWRRRCRRPGRRQRPAGRLRGCRKAAPPPVVDGRGIRVPMPATSGSERRRGGSRWPRAGQVAIQGHATAARGLGDACAPLSH